MRNKDKDGNFIFELKNLVTRKDVNGQSTNQSSSRPENQIKILRSKNSITSDLVEDDSENEKERLRWSSFWEYFLSIIGFVIDLGKYKWFRNVKIY